MSETDGVKWHVVPQGQRLIEEINPTGIGFIPMWEVSYIIDSGPAQGTPGMVKVPASNYNGAIVQATIAAQVRQMHEVGGL